MGTSNFPKIAFIGLGVMGREMVRHLITAGYPVKIYDISSDAISALAEQGGTASDSVATAVCDAQIVISMLPNTPQVEEVVYRDGIIDHMPGGGIYIDMSTISPEATRAMASALAAKSIFMLDGPVSGGADWCKERCIIDHGRRRAGCFRTRRKGVQSHGCDRDARRGPGRWSDREAL